MPDFDKGHFSLHAHAYSNSVVSFHVRCMPVMTTHSWLQRERDCEYGLCRLSCILIMRWCLLSMRQCPLSIVLVSTEHAHACTCLLTSIFRLPSLSVSLAVYVVQKNACLAVVCFSSLGRTTNHSVCSW